MENYEINKETLAIIPIEEEISKVIEEENIDISKNDLNAIIYRSEGDMRLAYNLIDKYIDEYCDASTERGKKLREIICKELKLTTLGYQSIAGLIEAIGLPAECVCTYCWNGKG